MPVFILKRLLANLPTLLTILGLVFLLLNLAPGDPVDAFTPPGQSMSVEQKEVLRHQLGLDRSVPERFVIWLGQVVRGDLGYRYKDGSLVIKEIASRIPATLLLTMTGLGVGSLLGVGLGLLAAKRPGGKLDVGLSSLAYVGISAPAFLLGILAMYFFALKLGWFPTSGYSKSGGCADPPHPAGICAVGPVHRHTHALHAIQRARGSDAGLHANRARQRTQ
jgi:peptide/nickel transport system permease protein